MCGEHALGNPNAKTFEGSSPHVRGTPAISRVNGSGRGIIPACAGNTRLYATTFISTRDHPRMCGEHSVLGGGVLAPVGSSPHVRGTLIMITPLKGRLGIIPACAGNTARLVPARRADEDHPRMCGEHMVTRSEMKSVSGSSPHVRGTLRACRAAGHLSGIIPACAGNTKTSAYQKCSKRDHPRMCGEHPAGETLGGGLLGSSPHVRGTRREQDQPGAQRGIIPACAGNTSRKTTPVWM